MWHTSFAFSGFSQEYKPKIHDRLYAKGYGNYWWAWWNRRQDDLSWRTTFHVLFRFVLAHECNTYRLSLKLSPEPRVRSTSTQASLLPHQGGGNSCREAYVFNQQFTLTFFSGWETFTPTLFHLLCFFKHCETCYSDRNIKRSGYPHLEPIQSTKRQKTPFDKNKLVNKNKRKKNITQSKKNLKSKLFE